MKKVLFTLLAFAVTGSVLFAQSDDGENAPSAKIEFQTESHEFGDLDEGPKASYDFHFTNTGNEPLILKNVKASCGCTTPHWPKEPIMPGETGKITAVYNTKGRPGKFTKVITVTSNAEKSTNQLYIKGNVLKADPMQNVPERKPSIVSEPFEE